MDYKSLLSGVRDYWASKRLALSKEEIKNISGKEGFRNSLCGFMSREYYKRKALIERGDILIGYTFKIFLESSDSLNEITSTWVLFSPSTKVNENPDILKKVLSNLQKETDDKRTTQLPKSLFFALTEAYADAAYMEIPPQFSEGELVYLSIANRFLRATPDLKLGYNLILASKGVSRGILYLPPRYWTPAWAEYYKGE